MAVSVAVSLLGGPAVAAPEGIPSGTAGTSAYWGTFYFEGGAPLTGVTTVAIGSSHILGLRPDGTVVAQGGVGSGSEVTVPVELTRAPGTVTAIAAGNFFSMALKANGTVALWGRGPSEDPSLTSGAKALRDVVAIAAGDNHALALKSDGTVVAWGGNADGQTNVPSGLRGVVAVSAGYYHSLALKRDGTVVGWGGTRAEYDFGQVTPPAGLGDVVQVSAGGMHSVAVKSNGTVVGWGTSMAGITDTAALRDVKSVAAGYTHTLGLKGDGTVVAWGRNWAGEKDVPSWLGGSVIAVSAGQWTSAVVHTTAEPVPVFTSAEPTLTRGSDGILRVDVSLWDDWVDLSYVWHRNGVEDSRGRDGSLKLTADDLGSEFTVTVTGTSPGYQTVVRTSKPLMVGAPLTATPKPTISGTPSSGQTLTAIPGAWAPAPVALSYQWFRADAAIKGATKPSYTLADVDAGTAISVKVTGTKMGHDAVTTSSNAVQIAAALTAAPVPTVAGTPRAGETLVATSGTWAPAPVTLAYQWLRNGVAISGATASRYALTAADAGKAITVAVTGSKAGYGTTLRASTAMVVESALTAAPVPVITGTLAAGQTLTAKPGAWEPAPVALSYSWLRGGVPISGATKATYKLTAADAGASVSVTVTGKKAGYTTAVRSSALVQIAGVLSATPAPTVAGALRAGEVLTATSGVWGPAPVTLGYQWRRSGVAIAGATASRYTLTAADAGKAITVAVTGSKDGFTAVVKTSASLTIERALTATPVPALSGNTRVGQTLKAKPGTWAPRPVALAYQWLRGGAPIGGATKATYTLTAADAGGLVSVTVTGKKAGYTTVVRSSALVQIDEVLSVTPAPTVAGAPRAGEVLTASAGVWGPAPVALGYQWRRSGVAIAGATAATYTLTAADRGKAITVAVTGSKVGFTAVVKTSAALTIERAFTAAAVPRLTGTPRVGATVKAAAGTWSPRPVPMRYQWLRDGLPIGGATRSAYKITVTDLGKLIAVTVTGQKAGYTAAARTSGTVLVR